MRWGQDFCTSRPQVKPGYVEEKKPLTFCSSLPGLCCRSLKDTKILMKMGLGLVLVGHVNFLLGALVHGTVLRDVKVQTATIEYAISNIIALVAGLVVSFILTPQSQVSSRVLLGLVQPVLLLFFIIDWPHCYLKVIRLNLALFSLAAQISFNFLIMSPCFCTYPHALPVLMHSSEVLSDISLHLLSRDYCSSFPYCG